MATVDTSVFIAAFPKGTAGSGSPSREVLGRLFDGHFRVALSPALERELWVKLRTFKVSATLVTQILDALRPSSVYSHATTHADAACRDPSDLFVVVLALSSGSRCIVSYDKDFGGTPPSWRPTAFLQFLRDHRGEGATHRHGDTSVPAEG